MELLIIAISVGGYVELLKQLGISATFSEPR